MVKAGFETRFEGRPDSHHEARGCDTEPTARSAGLAILAADVWANYAMFNMLRRILAELGSKPGGNADAPFAMVGIGG